MTFEAIRFDLGLSGFPQIFELLVCSFPFRYSKKDPPRLPGESSQVHWPKARSVGMPARPWSSLTAVDNSTIPAAAATIPYTMPIPAVIRYPVL